MKKEYLEVITAVGSVAILIILIVLVTLMLPSSTGYGFTAALLIFVVLMGMAGLKLAQIPDK